MAYRLTSGFIGAVDDVGSDAQPSSGFGPFDQFLDQGDAGEDDAFAGTGELREDLVLDRIVLRAVSSKQDSVKWTRPSRQFLPEFKLWS